MQRFSLRCLPACPAATAKICGSEKYPDLQGTISFFSVPCGTVVVSEVTGLPADGFFAMHIHNGSACSGNAQDPFADAGSHLNMSDCSVTHPFHTGDLLPLMSNQGYAWSAFLTERFKPCEVRGYPVIIHKNPDDFHTQPSGNAGEKIACGIIR